MRGERITPDTDPREASTLIFKIRSCSVITDLQSKPFSADFAFLFKIRSYRARSDLKNKIARFSGTPTSEILKSVSASAILA